MALKVNILKHLNLSENPKSMMLCLYLMEMIQFLLNLKMDLWTQQKKFAVRKKIYDSVIILTDILNMGISNLKDHMQYILVYNETVNAEEREVKNKKSYVQPSESFDNFAKIISKQAKSEYVCFGVKIFENYCFKNVHTYTEKEFEQFLTEN